ncbi:MAG: general secretion pathway protein GspB [Aquabacterium sp.]|nr:general secretion pathway protein GspB [Aquabacterium sp.]MBP8191774.1 general secretion pathway protein GspB [Aquabacterium sp.]
MSYILDALRKADSERERGEIPGLHAQTAASLDDSAPTSSVNQKLVWAVAALTAVLVLVLSWLIWGRSETQPERPPMPPEHAAMSMRPAPPPTAPQVMAPPVTPPVAGLYPPVNTTPPVAQTQPVTAAPAVPTLQPQAVVAAPPQPKAEAPIAPIARKAAATEESKLYRLMDLPESVRKDLPTLTIGGAMYSDTASQRMLIINSQVLHEGDKISNDLTLESIQLKSAIFRFRTYRYVVNY